MPFDFATGIVFVAALLLSETSPVYAQDASVVSWNALNTAFYTYAAFVGILGIQVVIKWNIKSLPTRYDLTLGVLIRWAVVLARLAAFAYFIFIFAVSLYWFIVARSEQSIPPWDNYSFGIMRTSIIVVFVFSVVSCLFEFLRQCTVDMFFMDWERPHGRLQATGELGAGGPRNSPISVWRSLFIAHEWTKLQTYRRTSVALTLILMLLFMIGLQYRNLNVLGSVGDFKAVVNQNIILLFAVNSLVWLMILLVQWLLRFMFYDRFYENKLLQFVDTISLANISMFVMDFPYHGYYVHGRSVHPHADTDMMEMKKNLLKEQNDLVSKRGLNGSDQQTFEIYITSTFRESYERIHSLHQLSLNRPTGSTNQANYNNNRSKLLESEASHVYDVINKMLCSFFDNNLKDNRYTVRDRSWAEARFGASPDFTKGSEFLNDDGIGFADTIWYGIEWDMQLLYLMIYNMIDIFTNQTWVAITVVFFIDWALLFIRQNLGRSNIARKTLIDERFLF